MNAYYKVEVLAIDSENLTLLINGQKHVYPLKHASKKLLNATQQEREHIEISPSGYGIHWPLFDEDLSIDRLLGIIHNPQKSHSNHIPV